MSPPRVSVLVAGLALASCTITAMPLTGPSSFHVAITKVNGKAPPPRANPLPANRGQSQEEWEFTIDALDAEGNPVAFDGLARLSVRPGAVVSVKSDGGVGRNVLVKGGKATGTASVTAVYGPTNLWVDDIGYVPAPIGKVAACANGKDDNGNVLIDFPADPGCAFADDDTEDGGTFTSGISAPVQYALPTVGDVQGFAAATPYPFEGLELNTSPPEQVVVTRVASDGFFVTDVGTDAKVKGYNNLYAFNFAAPAGMRVCDRVTYLAGTLNEFFGFTELSFPSYKLDYVYRPEDCLVPEPALLDAKTIATPTAMESLESGLVRLVGFQIAKKFGSDLVKNSLPTADATNCDLNGNGAVDFTAVDEGACANACDADADCTEFTNYSARGEYKVHLNATVIEVNTNTVPDFDPRGHRGEVIDAVTGTLRNFSGGKLNWTVETRCTDDLVCQVPGCGAKAPMPSNQACVRLRNASDNDQGTN